METTRLNVTLDASHAEALTRLASRLHLNEGTVARSLLASALDQVEPGADDVTALLDRIPGAWDAYQRGLADVAAGRTYSLDQLADLRPGDPLPEPTGTPSPSA